MPSVLSAIYSVAFTFLASGAWASSEQAGFEQAGVPFASAEALAQAIEERPSTTGRTARMNFRLINSDGRERSREAVMLRAERNDMTYLRIVFTEPALIADTAFLNHSRDGGADENWIYLPATERVRRIPSSDRSDSFMGTDLSYGDVSDSLKFWSADWTFSGGRAVANEPGNLMTLSGEARDDAVARELGYSRFEAVIDVETLYPREVTFFDPQGTRLKTVEVLEQRLIGGAWMAMRMHAHNHQTDHRTEIWFEEVEHRPDLPQYIFDPRELNFGTPVLD